MFRCESWTIKKSECRKIDAFNLWCWRQLLRVPWTARKSNQSTLQEINLEYSLEGLMLELKLQYFGHIMWRANSLEKTPILAKEKRAEDEMVRKHHQLNGHEFEQTLGIGEGQGNLVCCSPWGHKELDMMRQLNNWLSQHKNNYESTLSIFDLDHAFILIKTKKIKM